MLSWILRNWETIVFCIFILYVFYLYCNKCLLPLYNFLKQMSNISTSKVEGIITDNKLKSIYSKYHDSFVNINGNERTHDYAEDYFSEENILNELSINAKQMSSASGMLVGLGLLGTFFGLTIGIASFDSDSSEAIQNSIQSLLNGMGTAFMTSLFGMTFSCLFIVFEKYCMNEFSKQVNRICSVLNKKYYLSDNEFYASYLSFKDEQGNTIPISNVVRDIYADTQKQSELITHIINELSYTNEEGNVVPIGNAVRDIYDNTQKQSTYLSSLAGDLSDALEDKLSSNINEKVVPMIEKFVNIF